MGLCPKIVLALPRYEETHFTWLKSTYFYECLENRMLLIRNCPEFVEIALSSGDTPLVSTHSYDSSTSSCNMDHLPDEHQFIAKEEYEETKNIYFRTEERKSNERKSGPHTSLSLEIIQNAMRAESNKSYIGILKNRSSLGVHYMKNEGTVSFGDDASVPNLIDKVGSKKVVSFSWLPGIDWFEDLASDKQRSVSHTLVTGCSKNENGPKPHQDIPLLSALSSNKLKIDDKEYQGTVYMSFSERFHMMQTELMKNFFKEVLEYRNQLLELHWDNPGLFRDIIFTDEPKEAFEKLQELLKFSVEHHKETKPIFSFENDSMFKDTLKIKLDNLELERNIYSGN